MQRTLVETPWAELLEVFFDNFVWVVPQNIDFEFIEPSFIDG